VLIYTDPVALEERSQKKDGQLELGENGLGEKGGGAHSCDKKKKCFGRKDGIASCLIVGKPSMCT